TCERRDAGGNNNVPAAGGNNADDDDDDDDDDDVPAARRNNAAVSDDDADDDHDNDDDHGDGLPIVGYASNQKTYHTLRTCYETDHTVPITHVGTRTLCRTCERRDAGGNNNAGVCCN
ncbi:Hypothetical protein, putative, partial [Bodo saltans]